MKTKAFLILAALLMALGASAQRLCASLSLGGLVCTPSEVGARIGYKFGPTLQYYFSSKERTGFLETGMILTGKGWSGCEFLRNPETKLAANYLEFPVHIGYAVPLRHKVRFIDSMGPYFAVGLWGSIDGNYLSYKGRDLFKNKIYQRFDCGWGISAGIELPGHQRLSAGFEMSIVNPFKEPADINPSDRNISLTLSRPM